MPEDHIAIADALRAAIYAGDLAPGEKLPGIPHYAQLYGATNATVVRALRVLKDEGLVITRLGQGSFVRAGASMSYAAMRRLLTEAGALITELEAGGHPDPDVIEAWRARARAAGASV